MGDEPLRIFTASRDDVDTGGHDRLGAAYRHEGGSAVLRLSRPAEHRYRLETQLHRLNQIAAGEPAVDGAVFELRTDVRGPSSVTLQDVPAT